MTYLRLILYICWLFKEIIKSSLRIIAIIWRPNLKLEPVFEWIDCAGLSEKAIVLYGNSITLTPGTVTLDVSNNMLLVHALEQSSIDDLKKGVMRERVKRV